jgi:thiamine biosynthesis protein ThiS
MSNPPKIQIRANGEVFSIDSDSGLPEFLQSQELRLDRVVVELNTTALSRKEASDVILKDGDSLEIVRIVAGG